MSERKAHPKSENSKKKKKEQTWGDSPWTGKPDGLQSLGSQRVGHDQDWATNTHLQRQKNHKVR